MDWNRKEQRLGTYLESLQKDFEERRGRAEHRCTLSQDLAFTMRAVLAEEAPWKKPSTRG